MWECPKAFRPYRLVYINLHVKYGSNLKRTFGVKIQDMKIYFFCFSGSWGPLHKIQGYRGHQNVSCLYMGKNVKKSIFLAIWGALGGLQWSDLAYFALQLSSHSYLCACKIRKQSDKNFLSSYPKYENKNHCFIFGGPRHVDPYVKPKVTKFAGQ